jgi:ABC-type transport system substrate-binding protein
MEMRLTLRPGVTWHDGTPVTTKDILFNDEIYLDKDLPQTIITPRTFVDKLVAVDDRTISILWKQPYIQADIFAPDVMPAHLLEESYRQLNTSLTSHPYLSVPNTSEPARLGTRNLIRAPG